MKKTFKTTFSLLMALVLALSLSVTVFAQAVQPAADIVYQGEKKLVITPKDGHHTDTDLFSKFKGVEVDNVLIDESCYSAVSGSTIVTLKSGYLITVPVGIHKLTVVYEDGECSTNFEIKEAAPEQTTPTYTDTSNTSAQGGLNNNAGSQTSAKNSISPQTGDSRHFALLFALLLASGAGILGAVLYRKRKNHISFHQCHC